NGCIPGHPYTPTPIPGCLVNGSTPPASQQGAAICYQCTAPSSMRCYAIENSDRANKCYVFSRCNNGRWPSYVTGRVCVEGMCCDGCAAEPLMNQSERYQH